jgi:hypothetical protein
MEKQKAIQIGCPQYRVLVPGTYERDEHGRYVRAVDGQFLLPRVRCGQYGGKCMQTLCVLHRFNRGGSGSWYPSGVYALRETPDIAPREGVTGGTKGGWYA